MSNIKKYILLLVTIILLLLVTFLLETVFYYFNLLNPTTYNILKVVFLLFSFFVPCFILGRASIKRGYLEGIKLSIPLVFIFFLISVFTKTFSIKALLYYLIILLTSSFGSMLGISNKKEL